MTPGTGWIPDDAFLDRVKRAYRAAVAASSAPFRFSVWGKIGRKQEDVHNALMIDGNTKLRAIFSDPSSSDLFYGADNLCRAVIDGGINETALIVQAKVLVERLSISEFTFPNPFPNEMGYETPAGVISYRAALAVSQAMKVKELAGIRASVLEIGPGLGRTAYHARELGISNYTTVDLPIGMVAQSCFLGATIGPDNIWFATDNTPSANRIRLLTMPDLLREKARYDFVLNVDSIVEMPPLTALRYALWIRRNAATFLSINREYRRMKVRYLAMACFPFSRVSQQAYPFRTGYVEDLFTF